MAEDKLMFGIYAHAQSVVTIAKIKKHYMKSDTKAIAKEVQCRPRMCSFFKKLFRSLHIHALYTHMQFVHSKLFL